MDAGRDSRQARTIRRIDLLRRHRELLRFRARGPGNELMQRRCQSRVLQWICRGLVAKPVQRAYFGGISGDRLEGDARLENASEVGDAEKQHYEHRQDEGELDQGLAATRARSGSVWLWMND